MQVGHDRADERSGVNAPERRPFRFGFLSAAAIILLLMIVGQAVGTLCENFGPKRLPGAPVGPIDWITGLAPKDWILLAFFASAILFVVLQRAAILRFYRTMQTGVALVTFTALAIITGVLVPQITNFEDPTERVPDLRDIPAATVDAYLASPKRDSDEDFRLTRDDNPILATLNESQALRLKHWRSEYSAFRWAEAFFVYHLIHPYGIGMPGATLPAPVVSGLERFGLKYGKEERDNRELAMKAAFSGRTTSGEIGQLLREHDHAFKTAFNVCTSLSLNRTYKSHWFATLLGLLVFGVFFNTFKGAWQSWFTVRRGGYMLVHLGVMTLIAGGTWSKLKTDRGILNLRIGEEPRDVYDGFFDMAKPRRMPFGMSLDLFARRDWKTLRVEFPEEQFKSEPPEYTLWPGRTLDLDYRRDEKGELRPKIRLKVLALTERAHVGSPTWGDVPADDAHGGQGPMAYLTALDRGANAAHAQNGPNPIDANAEQPVFLVPDPRVGPYLDPAWQFRIAAVYGDDPKLVERALDPEDRGRVGWLALQVSAAGDVQPAIVPVHIGQTIQGPSGYTIKVVSAGGDLRFDRTTKAEILDPRPLREQFPTNPGFMVEITPSGGGPVERRAVVESFDAETQDLQKKYPYPDLLMQCLWDRWGVEGPPRYVVAWGPTRAPVLVSQGGKSTPIEIGRPLTLPGDTQVVARDLLHNVRFETKIDFDPSAGHISGPAFAPEFYATDPTGAEIEVTTDPETPTQKVEVIKMAATEVSNADHWSSPDKSFRLHYYENSRAMPFEWRSVLSVHEKGADGAWHKVDLGAEREREIRVNDYFVYKGYRFFQTNADARFPTYSGIGVVYDPGIPVVLFGMYLTIAGAIVAFIVRPILDGRKKRSTRSAA